MSLKEIILLSAVMMIRLTCSVFCMKGRKQQGSLWSVMERDP